MAAEGWSVRPARRSDINQIAKRMREADRRECAAVGHTPKGALVDGFTSSSMSWTACLDDRPVAMFGVVSVSMVEGSGAPWFLGTDAVWKGARKLLTWGPHFIRAMQADFPLLENRVWAENRPALRLLRALGFRVEDESVIVGDLPMLRFAKGA